MISKLSGRATFSGDRFIILETGGVGFKVFVLPESFKAIKTKGEEITLWTHMHVREDAMELYGFLEYPELEMFQMLIQISGIGPKSALGVLSIAPTDSLKSAISSGESSYLTKVSGIGKKMAERIIIELREKLGSIELTPSGRAIFEEEGDVLQALISLGYNPRDAREALKTVPKEITGISNRVKESLKFLGKK